MLHEATRTSYTTFKHYTVICRFVVHLPFWIMYVQQQHQQQKRVVEVKQVNKLEGVNVIGKYALSQSHPRSYCYETAKPIPVMYNNRSVNEESDSPGSHVVDGAVQHNVSTDVLNSSSGQL